MSIRVFEDVGAAKLNQSLKCGRVESIGPMVISVINQSDVANLVLTFMKERTSTAVYSDKDTNVSSEDTAYDGNDSTRDFTGQALNHLPILPRSVTIDDATNHKILRDTYGDGTLYLVATGQAAGTINYFTGALDLHYPAGQAPNGQINASYHYQDAALVHGGQKNFVIASGLPDDALTVYAACDNKAGARVKVESAASWA